MTSLHRTGRIRRPAAPPTPSDAIFGVFFGKDFTLPDADPSEASLLATASETDRLLKQSQELLSRLRQAIEERDSAE